jgi:antirestriction protein ArdC
MSVYDEVTQAIIAELEQGVPGFRQHPHGNIR